MRFDLITLKLFVNVVDHGSIAKAAEHESIVASAASKRITDLEAQLGVALLVREHGGVVPTAAGEALARHAREVIQSLARIPGMLDTLGEEQSEIRILANQTAIAVVVEDIGRHLGKHPGVKFRLEEGQSLPIIEAVLQGSADIGIIGHYQPSGRLQVIAYRSVPLMLAVPAAHSLAGRDSISFSDALEFELITFVPGTAIRGWADEAAARLARKMKFTMQVSSYEAMRMMVGAGLGIAVIPAPNITPFVSHLNLKAMPLTDDWARMQLYLVCRKEAALSTAASEFVAHLARC